MLQHQQILADPDDSDASVSPEDYEVFDGDEFEYDSDTDATSVEDFDFEDDLDAEIDLEDQIQLFGGNAHPPEYYRQAVEEFNASALRSGGYSEGSKKLLDAAEQQWYWYEARDSLPFMLAYSSPSQVLFHCLARQGPSTVFRHSRTTFTGQHRHSTVFRVDLGFRACLAF
jgi:hypothetical protein